MDKEQMKPLAVLAIAFVVVAIMNAVGLGMALDADGKFLMVLFSCLIPVGFVWTADIIWTRQEGKVGV